MYRVKILSVLSKMFIALHSSATKILKYTFFI